ncbi:MAG: molybdopterin-guanine dinucleotide biosynthesis protein B [Syntrophomonadaceae bacterium]|nr:molybdopterin-guanine dinucleotide biosynthesis protein B [Syntrophomonadaceae bacterium]
MIPFVSLVGYSNSGKTTVMASLIRIIKQRGYRVAAVKHASHGYTMDPPGLDSWHYTQAGADQVVVAGPESVTMHEFVQNISLKDILDRIKNVDVILVEGFKNQPGPKIEIFRSGISADRVPENDNLLAVVSDIPVAGDTPVFLFEQLEELADFIIHNIK